MTNPSGPSGSDTPSPPSPDDSFAHVLASRRMCRDFLDAVVDPDALDRVLRAAFRGPSAGNTQALDLLVLSGARVERYWELTLPAERRASFPWPGLLRAPILVVPVVDPDAYLVRYREPDKVRSGLGQDQEAWAVPYWYIDGGAGAMALLLAAEAEGLGALFFGQFDHEAAVSAEFGVPPGRRALGTIALGHPADGGRSPSASARRGRGDPGDRLRHEHW